MLKSTNTPYVKQYNLAGIIINPIKGKYVNSGANRQTRRAAMQKAKFFGESKNHHLTVGKMSKYLRIKQAIKMKDGSVKFIEHYLSKK